MVSCFKGELPTVLADMEMYCEIELDYVRFLSEVVYLGIHGLPFEAKGLEFVKAVIKEATHLEAVILEGVFCEEDERVSLDELCTYLTSHPTFLSNVRLLKILSCHPGYVVSREVFDNLITAYFSASTDRTQKLQFTGTKIKSYDIYYDCSPKIDQHYLLFKTIELDNCRFVSSYKATTKTIPQWLGQGISELESELGSCLFRVKEKASGMSRKRKFSELDSEDVVQSEKLNNL